MSMEVRYQVKLNRYGSKLDYIVSLCLLKTVSYKTVRGTLYEHIMINNWGYHLTLKSTYVRCYRIKIKLVYLLRLVKGHQSSWYHWCRIALISWISWEHFANSHLCSISSMCLILYINYMSIRDSLKGFDRRKWVLFSVHIWAQDSNCLLLLTSIWYCV